jgi:hypothetical protein
MAAYPGLQSWEASIPDFDKTPICVSATYYGQKAMIPRIFGYHVSVVVEKNLFGQTRIKSKSVWSYLNQLRVPIKVQCIPIYRCNVMLCYALSCWSHDFIRVVDSLLLNQTWKLVRNFSDPLVQPELEKTSLAISTTILTTSAESLQR